MKPSLQKLQKFFKLEAERGYDNHAVLGGLERMLEHWAAEARADQLDEELIQAVEMRIRDYSRLVARSRAEVLDGLWLRIQRSLPGTPDYLSAKDRERFSQEKPGVEPDSLESSPLESASLKPVSQEPSPANFSSQEVVPQPPVPQERAGKAPSVSPPRPARSKAPRRRARGQAVNAIDVHQPVTVVPGIGPRHAQTLNRLGINTVRDMLYHLPRRYDDYSQLKPINRLWYGDEVTVIGTLQSVVVRSLRGGKMQVIEAVVSDGSGSLRVSWFNQSWLVKRLKEGDQVVLSGKIDQHLGRLQMNSPDWEALDQEHLHTNRIVPVYALTADVTQKWLRRQMFQAVSDWALRVPDPLTDALLDDAELVDLPTALQQVHFPNSWDDLHAARERLGFDEIFLLQLGVLRQKRAWQERSARIFEVEDAWLEGRLAALPFSLTAAQQRVLDDMRHDLSAGRPMNRLVQGDVGSGKTAVAALAISIIAQHGAQAALMAPTSILAEQHYKSLKRLLAAPSTIEAEDGMLSVTPALLDESQICLIVGATPEVEKQQARENLANGTIKVVVGTHALIEDPVTFADLQLAVVDEQHRFGVEQRSLLRAKGENPHLLVMTATPIPRSLALTLYGDLDLSVIDEMPPGRQPVDTYVLTPLERERCYSLIKSQVEAGRQAFIIYPLVEESEKSESKSAVEEHKRLQKEIFPALSLGLLHGRMPPEEKEEVMARFRDGVHHILVSTTVVEVGVDVPNATVMLIEGANRFGLAQLHQLRGRVGRGADKSYCLLIAEKSDDVDNERLQAMSETNDGFVLAERDLEQRGPGDFLGTRQAGFAELQVSRLTDVRLIEKARRHAQALFELDSDLQQPEHQALSAALQAFWQVGKGDVS